MWQGKIRPKKDCVICHAIDLSCRAMRPNLLSMSRYFANFYREMSEALRLQECLKNANLLVLANDAGRYFSVHFYHIPFEQLSLNRLKDGWSHYKYWNAWIEWSVDYWSRVICMLDQLKSLKIILLQMAQSANDLWKAIFYLTLEWSVNVKFNRMSANNEAKYIARGKHLLIKYSIS